MRARIRSVKPDIFHDEELWALGESTGMPVYQGFQGLWCYADREGRFEWRPGALRSLILPYWHGDFEALLEALASAGFVVKYTVAGRVIGWVRSFSKHQALNNRELPSVLPAPPPPVPDAPGTRADACPTRGYASPRGSTAPGYVYVATYPGAGAFKVGFSADHPSRRVHDLSTSSPEPMQLVDYVVGTKALEAEIHRALTKHHRHREWFVIDDDSCRVLLAWFTRGPRVSDQSEWIGSGSGSGIGSGSGVDALEREPYTQQPDDRAVDDDEPPESWPPLDADLGEPEPAPPPVAPASAPAEPTKLATVREVFTEWQTVHGHPNAKLDPDRTKRIRSGLAHFTPEQLKQAIRGALKDEWLMGRDPKSTRKYDGLETILKSPSQIERLIELERAPPVIRRIGPSQPRDVFAYAKQRIDEEQAKEGMNS